MKKKNYYVVATIFFVVLICVIYLICNNKHTEEINYIGKTRQEVLRLCDIYPKFKYGGTKDKIMIWLIPAFVYYDNVIEALNSPELMQAPHWTINFVYGRNRLGYGIYHCYTVFFNDKGVVYKQEKTYIRK